MTACFVVRAKVIDATVRNAFERWYQEEHLADAHKAFNARRAWRGWSDVDPNVHYAVYENNAGQRPISTSTDARIRKE